MKGIDGILAHGGRSSETTGIECDLDFQSLTSGTAFRLTANNLTGKFIDFRSSTSAATVFSIDNDGTIACRDITISAGGFTVTAGGITVTAGGIDCTGNAEFKTGISVSGSGASISGGNVVITSGYPVDINTGVSVNGGVSISGTLYTSKNFPVDINSGCSITGGVSVTGKLFTTKNFPVDINSGCSITSGLSVSGTATFTGAVNANNGLLTASSGISVATGVSVRGALKPLGADLRSDMNHLDVKRQYVDYFEDFTDPYLAGTGATAPWLFTETTGTTSQFHSVDGEPFGVYQLTAASCSTTRAQIVGQHKNEFVKIVSGKKYYFEARVALIQKAAAGSFYIGLTNADTDLFAGVRSAPDCTDFIGFTNYMGGCSWHLVAGTQAAADKNSATSSPNLVRAIQGTYYRLGFKVDTTGTGTTVVTPYIDGVEGTAVTEMTSQAGTSYPSNTALTVSAGVSTGAAGGNRMYIDYINMICQR